tara:strand:- start:59 stop:241 length:183 start_codon:yes stop_codon:yes gene_type:complete
MLGTIKANTDMLDGLLYEYTVKDGFYTGHFLSGDLIGCFASGSSLDELHRCLRSIRKLLS